MHFLLTQVDQEHGCNVGFMLPKRSLRLSYASSFIESVQPTRNATLLEAHQGLLFEKTKRLYLSHGIRVQCRPCRD